jgi:hypothetical protein
MNKLEALEHIAGIAETILRNATSLQPDQFNPETYEVDAYEINQLVQAMEVLTSIESIETDTKQHIMKVRRNITAITHNLNNRAIAHDASKLKSPEVEIFAEVSPQLSSLEYGSEQYTAMLERLKPALNHHYALNSHHPEHWVNGIDDMSLLDIAEMLADWKAASERHANGNMVQSLEINTKRFGISSQLASILHNTAKELGWLL